MLLESNEKHRIKESLKTKLTAALKDKLANAQLDLKKQKD